MVEVTMASLAIEFERIRNDKADDVRDLKALCLRYGGPDGSDWGELLAWIERALDGAYYIASSDYITSEEGG